jgi:hypothetical protein
MFRSASTVIVGVTKRLTFAIYLGAVLYGVVAMWARLMANRSDSSRGAYEDMPAAPHTIRHISTILENSVRPSKGTDDGARL